MRGMAPGPFASVPHRGRRVPTGLLIALFAVILTAAAWITEIGRAHV